MIFHGDFFDEKTWKALPDKMPFEDLVRDYIRDHAGATYDDCSRDLGICVAAVYAAVASLQAKGICEKGEDDA